MLFLFLLMMDFVMPWALDQNVMWQDVYQLADLDIADDIALEEPSEA